MNKRDRRALGQYIRGVADLVELRDWTFELTHDPCDDEKDATVSIIYGRKHATIAVSERFREFDRARQRQTIAHELVHCHLESACSMVRCDLDELLGKPADSVFWHGYRRQLEYGVDALSDALAKHLPFIDWPPPKR